MWRTSTPYPCRERCAIGSSADLRDSLREWLPTFTWELFITVTFAQARMPWLALNTLNQVAGVIKRSQRPSLMFLGTEQHQNRTLHVHGMITGRGGCAINPRSLWKDLFDTFGRSDVSPILSREAVTDYCTKYVTKSLTEYLIW